MMAQLVRYWKGGQVGGQWRPARLTSEQAQAWRVKHEHHGQNRAVKASRSVNGSTGWKCTSSTGPASPGNCEP